MVRCNPAGLVRGDVIHITADVPHCHCYMAHMIPADAVIFECSDDFQVHDMSYVCLLASVCCSLRLSVMHLSGVCETGLLPVIIQWIFFNFECTVPCVKLSQHLTPDPLSTTELAAL